jgi:4-amino-4-deoxy-L-arabinose transferase-like glycosyltransferase
MSNLDRMKFIVEISLGTYALVLALGYAWMKAVRYPFTLRQRRMWTYYVLFISSLPVLAPLCVAMGLWILPPKESGAVCIAVLLAWTVTALLIVHHMCKPGGRLSDERQGRS